MTRRVYVAATGAVTPLGLTWDESFEKLTTGATAIQPFEDSGVRGFAASIDHSWSDPERRLSLVRMVLGQLSIPVDNAGVFLGAESGRAELAVIKRLAAAAGGGAVFDHASFGQAARPLAEQVDASIVSPSAVSIWVASQIGATGPVETVSLACASGLAAIAEAVRAIRLGEIDTAVCGGVGADVDPLMIAGFGKLGALSERGVSCPIDVRRDGFVVGEGAALVVLTTQPHAIEVTGIGRSLDAHHLTAPDPTGGGAFRAMQAALTDANVDSVSYVQAHGTSTPLNDVVEARAIRRVLHGRPAVSSVKGALGHWIAGAGAIGFVTACETLRRGIAVPTAGLARVDPECDVDHIVGDARHADYDSALINSFAFGGANCSVVVRRCDA